MMAVVLVVIFQATAQGHKPSRGAEVDKEIEEDDAEVLKMKDKAAGKTNPEPYLK